MDATDNVYERLARLHPQKLWVRSECAADPDADHLIGILDLVHTHHSVALVRKVSGRWEVYVPTTVAGGPAWLYYTTDIKLQPIDALQVIRERWGKMSQQGRESDLRLAAKLLANKTKRGLPTLATSEQEPDYGQLAMTSNGLITHRVVQGNHWFGLSMFDGTYHPIMKAVPVPELGWVLDYPLDSNTWKQDTQLPYSKPNCVEMLQAVQDRWFRATNGQKIVWLKTARHLALKLSAMAIESVEHFLVPDKGADAVVFGGTQPKTPPSWDPTKPTVRRTFSAGMRKPADEPCHEPGGYKPWMLDFLKGFEQFLTIFPRLKLVHDVVGKKRTGLLLDVRDGEYQWCTQLLISEANEHVAIFRALREDYCGWCAAQANARKKK